MMNNLFAIATTSIAFSLQLSKRQCNTLLRLDSKDLTELNRLWIISVDGLTSLNRKGLVFWHTDEKGQPCGFGGLTEAGKLVVALLKEAGLDIESTNTSLVQKRMERLDAFEAKRKQA